MCKCRNVNLKLLRVGFKMRRKLATVKEETVRKSLCSSDTAIYGAVMVTAVLSYVNSLGGEFVHDDIPAIVDNADVTGASPVRSLLVNDFWGMPMADVNSHKSYRPLTTLSFRLNYALSGLRPAWWHACNIILHAACCVLVARACVQVARLQRPFAALAALLFAVHPIHTEAVAGVVGRADVLACIFFLSSLLLYHRPTSNKKYVWLSIVLGALSMFAKETGVTILILNLAFDFYRCWPLVKRSLSSLRVEKKSTGLSVRTLKVLISLSLLVCLRLALLQGSLPTFSPQDNPAAFHPSFVVRFMTFCYLAAFNWWLLLCPWSLSHDWQMGSVPLVTSGWDPRNLLTCAAFGALLLLCYRCFCDLEAQRHTPVVVGVLILVMPFVPASNLFVTVGFVIAERILYIPSVGSVIITAYGVQLMWYSRPGAKVILVIGVVILAISGVLRTHRRNMDWKDRATLLRADLLTLPHNAKLQYNFGNFLRETDHQDQAIRHYKEALRLWPTYASAHNNLGTLVTGLENAEYHFLQAIKYNRHHVNAHYNLGKLYKKSGNTYQAIELFEKCVSLQPHFIQAYIELLSLKEDEAKKRILEKILELEKNNLAHYVLYGNWLKSKGLIQAAALKYVEATRLSFEHREARHVRGDLVSMRLVALCYRSLGYKSRILQLLIRWHTWKRGRLSPAPNIYLQEWHLKLEMKKKAQIYTKASTLPVKSTRCFDYSQLTVKSDVVPVSPNNKTSEGNGKYKKHKQIRINSECSKCDKKCSDNIIETNQNSVINDKVNEIIKRNSDILKSKNKQPCSHKNGTKKRTVRVSLTSNIKTIHNKSETGQEKDKQCSLDKKEKSRAVINANNMPSITAPLSGKIIFNTF